MSFGVLFQAPDTQVRAPRPEPATRDGDDVPAARAASGSETSGPDRADGSGDDEQPNRSRRRGGR